MKNEISHAKISKCCRCSQGFFAQCSRSFIIIVVTIKIMLCLIMSNSQMRPQQLVLLLALPLPLFATFRGRSRNAK